MVLINYFIEKYDLKNLFKYEIGAFYKIKSWLLNNFYFIFYKRLNFIFFEKILYLLNRFFFCRIYFFFLNVVLFFLKFPKVFNYVNYIIWRVFLTVLLSKFKFSLNFIYFKNFFVNFKNFFFFEFVQFVYFFIDVYFIKFFVNFFNFVFVIKNFINFYIFHPILVIHYKCVSIPGPDANDFWTNLIWLIYAAPIQFFFFLGDEVIIIVMKKNIKRDIFIEKKCFYLI